jgi:hypothetical protein
MSVRDEQSKVLRRWNGDVIYITAGQGIIPNSRRCQILWDIPQYSPTEVDRRFRGAYCLRHQGNNTHRPENGGTKHL